MLSISNGHSKYKFINSTQFSNGKLWTISAQLWLWTVFPTVSLNCCCCCCCGNCLLLASRIFGDPRSLKLSQLLWCRRDRCVRYYIVITVAAVWVNYPKYLNMQATIAGYRWDTVKIRHLAIRWQEYVSVRTYPSKNNKKEVKVIWQKASHGGPIPRLGVTPGGRKLYHWIPGVGFPISIP